MRDGTARRLVGAALLGVGTLFLLKQDPHEHWATPPVVEVVIVSEHAGDDEPLGPGARLDPAALEPDDTDVLFPEPDALLTDAAAGRGG